MMHRLFHIAPTLAALTCTVTLVNHAVGAEPYIKPGDTYIEITSPHLRTWVPANQAHDLDPFIRWADATYVAMAQAAGYTITKRLDLLLSDEFDSHNGFSTVIPTPLVQIQLAPALPSSTIFDGADPLRRTLIHEFAHQISNDRTYGFRKAVSSIFGRILPFDIFSLGMFYLSAPAHVTMPRFWHEGTAQWAETVYAPADSAWGGRGRDPLTHMVWRLDAANGSIPEVGEWRSTAISWPFGSTAYVYGIAYARWLEGHVSDQASVWELITDQGHNWAFAFNNGPLAATGKNHAELIRSARLDLLVEQRSALAVIRTQPVTTSKRLTPINTNAAPPAWLDDGRLVSAINDPWNTPRLCLIGQDASLERTNWSAFAGGGIRRINGHTFIRCESPTALNPWARSRIEVLYQGAVNPIPSQRCVQADGYVQDTDLHVAAIQLQPGGHQALIYGTTSLTDLAGAIAWKTIPTARRTWSPAWSADGKTLAWIETDEAGSHLQIAALDTLESPKTLWSVRGRLLHPVWKADNSHIIVCSDVSGVANAYVVPLDGSPATAITNTIGGIVACVPSPDGKQFAIIDYDHQGPYVSVIANDSAHYAKQVPEVPPAWPAPGGTNVKPTPALAVGAEPDLSEPVPYHGFPRIRPLFWTPTTFASPEGGYGIYGYAADPLFTHQTSAGLGVGGGGYEPVGHLTYLYSGWNIELGATAYQSERDYNNLLVATNGEEYSYIERYRTAQLIAGRGISGSTRGLFAYVGVGMDNSETSERGAEEYEDVTIATPDPFTGSTRFIEGTVGYGDTQLFPTSYAREQGMEGAVVARRSGFGGDLDQTKVLGKADLVWSVWPRGGHQIVLGGQVGRAVGDQTLQGSFSIGGILGQGLPRGYYTIQAVGSYLLAGSVAYRLPLWRPFDGFNSSPWVHRQIAMEIFYDAGQVSNAGFTEDAQFYASTGIEIHDEWEFYGFTFQPGIGFAQQLDGEKDPTVYFTLSFR